MPSYLLLPFENTHIHFIYILFTHKLVKRGFEEDNINCKFLSKNQNLNIEP